MIRVLLVDDSNTSRQLLRHIIESAPDMAVVGELADGTEAVRQVGRLRPDVILMDVFMPEMDGMDATRRIMMQQPTPIVMISATAGGREAEMAFKAMKRGALTLLAKPDGPEHPLFDVQAKRVVDTLRAMAGVRVIHHREPKITTKPATTGTSTVSEKLTAMPEIIGVVASTGGPAALAEIAQALPADFPVPIIVVQHIHTDFQPSLVRWIDSVCPLPVRLAQVGDMPQPGITFAPVGRHLLVDAERRYAFRRTPQHIHTPSGDMLLASLAAAYGPQAIGVILTGMGADGATGLLEMYRQGAITLGQNETTAAVYGMPAEAKRLGAVRYELALNAIVPMLRDILERKTSC